MTGREGLKRLLQFQWLKSTWAILGGIAGGVLIGIVNKPVAALISPLGDLYLSFLKMCVIPIMITALVPSLGRLLLSKETSRYLKRLSLVFVIALLTVSAVGLAVGFIGQPGEGLSGEARTTLGQVLMDSETSSGSSNTSASSGGLLGFIINMIPSNIFSALVEGNNLQILFFSIIFGITLGFVPSAAGETLLSLMEVVFKVFQKAISWTMYILPVGLLCIMAGQIARTGVDILLAMVKFVALIHVAAIILMLISAVVIRLTIKKSILESFQDLKKTLIIAFGTRNSIATMPSMLDVLRNNFRLEQSTVNLVIPLGVILCRYSMVLIFSMAIVFISQLYYVPLGLDGILIALIGAVIAAVAGAGAPGVVSLSMLALVLDPLGLPAGATIILLLAINPIIDPIVTVANVHLNCAAATLIAKQEDGGEPFAESVHRDTVAAPAGNTAAAAAGAPA